MKRSAWMLIAVFSTLLTAAAQAPAQESVVSPGENLVVDGVPSVPTTLAETAGRYGSYRGATLLDWNPSQREMLISTRFGDVPQLHLVKDPGAARQQLTFFQDAVTVGRFPTKDDDYAVFVKDSGGGEWYQLYRYEFATGKIRLMTDGKSRNLLGPFSSVINRILPVANS